MVASVPSNPKSQMNQLPLCSLSHSSSEVSHPLLDLWALPSKAANYALWLLHKVVWVLDGSFRAAQSRYLEGNFAPVGDELFEADLDVIEGAIPQDLEGAYVRVGPNPYVPPGEEREEQWYELSFKDFRPASLR